MGYFPSKLSKAWPLEPIAIIIGPFGMNFCSQKVKRIILATFGFSRIALRATQPKLARGIAGTFFFENEQGVAAGVNGDRCRTMLKEFLFTKNEEEDIGSIGFQQDSATCHTAEAIFDILRPVFEDRIISHRAVVVWIPRSCDLTPLDYYLVK